MAGDRPKMDGRWGWWMAALCCLVLYSPVEAETVVDRQARVARMKPADKEQLLRKQNRFRELESAEQDRLRQLHEALENDPQGRELRSIMQRYHEWLATLPPAQRNDLLKLDPARRVAEIKRIQAAIALDRLSPEEIQSMVHWMERVSLENMPAQKRGEWDQMPEMERRRLRGTIVYQFMQRNPLSPMPLLRDTHINDLKTVLSEDHRRQLDAATTRIEKQQVIAGWVRQVYAHFLAARGGAGFLPEVSEEKLRQFFDAELAEKDRNELLGLPGDEMQRQLRRRYFEKHLMPGSFPRPPAGGNQPPFKSRPRTGDGVPQGRAP